MNGTTRQHRASSDQPLDLEPCPLDFEPMPAVEPGKCNACGARLTGRQKKVCSRECKDWWNAQMTILGRKLAERVIITDQCANRKRRPKLRKRAFSEYGRLSRDFLRRRREMIERRERRACDGL